MQLTPSVNAGQVRCQVDLSPSLQHHDAGSSSLGLLGGPLQIVASHAAKAAGDELAPSAPMDLIIHANRLQNGIPSQEFNWCVESKWSTC